MASQQNNLPNSNKNKNPSSGILNESSHEMQRLGGTRSTPPQIYPTGTQGSTVNLHFHNGSTSPIVSITEFHFQHPGSYEVHLRTGRSTGFESGLLASLPGGLNYSQSNSSSPFTK